MADFAYPLFPVFAFLGFILSLIPLPWHLQAWNSGTCYYMMWASLACLNQFINSVIWANNVLNNSPVWCEISIRILLASSVGLPISSLCINRRLYQIASRNSRMGHAEKSRAILIDTLLCVLLPLVYVALQYIVQGHRFDIFEDIGCYPAIYNTLLTYFINCIWPIVIGLISACYCVCTLCAFARRRLEFCHFVNSSHSSLTASRYFRLMALAMSEIIFTIPLAIFNIWLNATVSPIGPWRSWDDTHFDYARVVQIPSLVWQNNHTLVISIEITRWVAPLCAFVFFAFFGFADEARKNYAKFFSWVVQRFGLERGRQHVSLKDTASIGKFNLPKTSISAKSSSSCTRTSILPTYSPPSSYDSVANINPTTSPNLAAVKDFGPEMLQDSFSGSAVVLTDLELASPTTTAVVSPNAPLSWKPVSGIPFSDRRHSSYF